MGAFEATVENDEYKSLQFVITSIDYMVTVDMLWDELDRVLLAVPLLCLVCFGDNTSFNPQQASEDHALVE